MGFLAALLVGCAVLAFFVLPSLVVSPSSFGVRVPAPTGLKPATAPTAADLVEARNSVRTAGIALIAGIGAALATGFAARTYYLSRRGQLAERYATAAGQLSSPVESVRVAGIVSLECVAAEAAEWHRQATATLAAFLRTRKRGQGEEEDAPSDVQAAFTAIGRRRTRYDRGLVLNLVNADLRRVKLKGARLRGADLRDAKLDGADLRDSDLRDATLISTQAPSVILKGAKLDGAKVGGAILSSATLDNVHAGDASFEDIVTDGTSFKGADLRKAKGLPLQDGRIRGAIVDGHTKLPT